MTMIRINLIAEKKAGGTKPGKKVSGQKSELEENLFLVVGVLAAIGVFFLMRHFVTKDLNAERRRQQQLEAEYGKVKHWKDKQLEYEIQKELLNEKIQRISSLKDRREGPVKLMEDVTNVIPGSVWLGSVTQGYDKNLTLVTGNNRIAFKPSPRNLSEPDLVQITGFAKTTEAITSFANKVLGLDKRYYDTELNNIGRVNSEGPKEYTFDLYFKIRRNHADLSFAEDEGDRP